MGIYENDKMVDRIIDGRIRERASTITRVYGDVDVKSHLLDERWKSFDIDRALAKHEAVNEESAHA